jgi:AraC-like DNA-binding protein
MSEDLAQLDTMTDERDLQARFFRALGDGRSSETLFDQIPDIVFFQKDRSGRYMSVNRTLVERCGQRGKSDLIGRRPSELFPKVLADHIVAQDRSVLESAVTIKARLELHLYPGRREGWCLTWKVPLYDTTGDLLGLSGISRDLRPHVDEHEDLSRIANVLKFIDENIARPLRIADLADLAGLSQYQLARRVRGLFGLTMGQYITKARIEFARSRLGSTDQAISNVALDCGYSDQAAFSRQFRQSVGLSPAAYRKNGR